MVQLGAYMLIANAERVLRGEQNTYTSTEKPLRYSRHPTYDPPANAIGVPEQGASWTQIKRNHCRTSLTQSQRGHQ